MAPLDVPCLVFRPGEARRETIDLHGAFTPEELREGVLCYSFAYRRALVPSNPGSLSEIGTVCEKREGTRYLEPNE